MRTLFLLIGVLLLNSCKDESVKPSPFLSEDTMVDMLYDLSLLTAIEGVSAYYSDTIDKIEVRSILNKYEIDSLAYVQNNEYYMGLEGGVYLAMQNEVKRRLEEQKVLVDTLVSQKDKEEMGLNKNLKEKLTLLRDSISPSVP